MVPDAQAFEGGTALCLSTERRAIAGAVSVPLEVDLQVVSERLCDTTEWSELAWFVDDASSEDPASNLVDVKVTAGGRAAHVRVAVECAPNTLRVQVYRSLDLPVAELRWVPVRDGTVLRLEGQLRVDAPIPLPLSARRLIAQRLLVGPTRALAEAKPTASVVIPAPTNLENP